MMVKHPAEVFGYPIEINSEQARKIRSAYWCPFVNLRCNKQSRLIDYPMGVCSVKYDDQIIALSPRRFLQNDIIFKDIADHYFKSRNNLLLFSEVVLPKVGTFDYVMVKHLPFRDEIEDFVIIEFQTAQTTGTGNLVKALEDYMNGEDIEGRSYNFGLNLADIWKRTFTQILNKGIVLENWRNKIYWVVQEPVYQDFVERYNIENLTYNDEDKTVFMIYDLKYEEDKYKLIQTRCQSSTIDNLFNAFKNNQNIPSKESFKKRLDKKIKAKMELKLRFNE